MVENYNLKQAILDAALAGARAELAQVEVSAVNSATALEPPSVAPVVPKDAAATVSSSSEALPPPVPSSPKPVVAFKSGSGFISISNFGFDSGSN